MRDGRRSGREIDGGLIRQQRRDGVEHADVDRLAAPRALARKERERDALRREHARDDVGDRDAEPHRGPVGGAGDAHQPALGLNHRVVAGLAGARSGLAETGDRAVHEPRMPRRQRLVVEPDSGQRPRREILDEDVALRDEPIEDRAPFGPLEVERDALLVPVDAEEVRALAFEKRRAPAARVVALAGLLDLDHARAHVGEHHGAIRARQHTRQVQDGDAFKRLHDG